MHSNLLAAAARLSDRDLLARLTALSIDERHATVELLAHLAELDKRKLHREQGYGSLYSYCTEVLRLSEHGTFNRIAAARASRAFPVILDLLAEGAVNLSTVRLLAPHLTQENHKHLLKEATGRRKRDVEALVARLAPRPDVGASVRKLPTPARPAPAMGEPQHAAPSAEAAATRPQPFGAPAPVTAPFVAHLSPAGPLPPRPVVAPLTPERYRIQFTVGHETQQKLRHVQDLLRREIPNGDPGAIFDRALTLLIEDVARKKLAASANPRPSRGRDPRSRHIPAEVKRKVWLRDHGQCAYVSPAGRRCRERAFLEFHHLKAFARGGETSVDNISLRCREHNAYEAELVFGPWDPGAVHESPASYSA